MLESVLIITRLDMSLISVTVANRSSSVGSLPLVILSTELVILTLSPILKFLGLLTLSAMTISSDRTTDLVAAS